jgi:hypothetical protein
MRPSFGKRNCVHILNAVKIMGLLNQRAARIIVPLWPRIGNRAQVRKASRRVSRPGKVPAFPEAVYTSSPRVQSPRPVPVSSEHIPVIDVLITLISRLPVPMIRRPLADLADRGPQPLACISLSAKVPLEEAKRLRRL